MSEDHLPETKVPRHVCDKPSDAWTDTEDTDEKKIFDRLEHFLYSAYLNYHRQCAKYLRKIIIKFID